MTVDEVSVVLDTMQPLYISVGIIVGFILSGLFYTLADIVVDCIFKYHKDKKSKSKDDEK
jgi:hypothetical protein